jgi:hypothetical protein
MLTEKKDLILFIHFLHYATMIQRFDVDRIPNNLDILRV